MGAFTKGQATNFEMLTNYFQAKYDAVYYEKCFTLEIAK